MRQWLRIFTIIFLCLSPLAGYTQSPVATPLPANPDAQSTVAAPPLSETAYPYIIGLGAIAGVVATQAILFGPAGFPFFTGTVASGASIAPEVSVGISRMYAVSSAVVGGWLGNWIYDH
ncbi:MAG TPA: hypothetical protein DCS21_06945 [Gammaproteobacteria bacterium]|nr:hypothetical protein [Gammaproteobacteria bacterium]